jgi:hypothetical protein
VAGPFGEKKDWPNKKAVKIALHKELAA